MSGANAVRDINRIKTKVVDTDPNSSTIYVPKHGDRYLYAYDITDGTQTTFVDIGAGETIAEVARDGSGNVYVIHSAIGGEQITKYDSSGTQVWRNFDDEVLTVTSLPIIDAARNRLVFLEGPILYAVDMDTGDTVLSYDYTGLAGPTGDYTGSRVCVGSDGYYYVSGGDPAYGGGEAIVWKIGGDGVIAWRWVHNAGGGEGGFVHTSPDVNYIIIAMIHHTGTTEYGVDAPSTSTLANYWIVDQEGVVQTSGSVNKDSNDKPNVVFLAVDLDYYIGFKSASAEDVYVVKYNASDDSEAWDYYITNNAAGSVFFIEEDGDGAYVFVGGTRETTWENTDAGNASIWWLDEDLGVAPPEWDGDSGTTCTSAAVYGGATPTDANTVEVISVVCDDDIVAIRDGTLATPSGGSSAVEATRFPMSQPAFGHIFFVDGLATLDYTIGYEASDDTIRAWVADSGYVPDKCSLISLYRGRVVLAGQNEDPHNWYMSAVGDPFDFDYTPATLTETQAVAGNNSDAGLIGDVVNTIIPWSDDTCIFGCDSSIHVMAGDPMAGGHIDQLTNGVGMSFGRSWAFDPIGTLYFHSIDGIYRLQPNGLPEPMTNNRIKRRLESWDLSNYYVILEWDVNQQALLVMLIKNDFSEVETVLVWEQRSDAWWIDEYPSAIGPSTFHMFDSDDVDDRYLLMGGMDGYIRKVDNTAATDDGTGINSFVDIGPYFAEPGKSVLIRQADVTLDGSSGAVDFLTYAGDTPKELNSTSAKAKKTLNAGLNRRVTRKVSGGAIKCRLNSPATVTTQWAIEQLSMDATQTGIQQRGRR
jgi:hypothetical protein